MISPEQVERALRSWRQDNESLVSVFFMAMDHGEGPQPPDEAIASLARHVAACLSSELVRFEVQRQPESETKAALW